MEKIYNPYAKYGLRRVINAATNMTRLGGSIPPTEVFRAMEDASKCFVHIPELQHWAGKIIAEVTGAEAGLPTAGASNGILLAAAACIMKNTELEKYNPLEPETWTHLIQKLPMHTEGLKTEFIVQKSNRNIYDHAVECAGGRLIEAGTDDGTTEKQLDEAFNHEKTAAYYFTVRSAYRCLPLKTVINIAHKHDVPVIVDAAAEVPPKKNLRRYIAEGADLVIFSGGKAIGGPNNSGILAGREDLIKLAHLQAYPFHGIGRAAKMSKETIVGLVTALKIYLQQDEKLLFEAWKDKAIWIKEQLSSIAGIKIELTYQTTVEEKEPVVPLVTVEIDEKAFGITGKELSARLRMGNPSIEAPYEPYYLLESCKGKLVINPQCMLEGDEVIVVQRIKDILTSKT